MKKIFLIPILLMLMIFIGVLLLNQQQNQTTYGAPPYIDDTPEQYFTDGYDYSNWKRPDGPIRVGLQAGHWKTNEMPDEQARLRDNGGGTSNGQVAEWEVNLAIAEETKKILEAEGIVVDILPATIPPGYIADAFVAIHADGSTDRTISGYKAAAPRRDLTGRATQLTQLIEQEYEQLTGLRKDPNITRNMTGYYAFSWRRFQHAIHPMTTASILETGFLTNPSDAQMLINNPALPAKALAQALLTYLQTIDTI